GSSGSSATGLTVSIQNFSFSPSSLTISPGKTVKWVNNDQVSHTVTDDNATFNSGSIAPGGTYSHTFPAAGTVTYHCNFHTYMKASVVVQ
ncbi:MAG: plastocyanin/azurin family copper-binding protein, partial [Chitinophagaceae bacterium]